MSLNSIQLHLNLIFQSLDLDIHLLKGIQFNPVVNFILMPIPLVLQVLYLIIAFHLQLFNFLLSLLKLLQIGLRLLIIGVFDEVFEFLVHGVQQCVHFVFADTFLHQIFNVSDFP